MGSPLSPILANLFMEEFEQALTTFGLTPKLWLRYVDDTFVLWPHSVHDLDEFHKQNSSIHFTIEHEKDNKIAFLDVMTHGRERWPKCQYII